MSKQSGGWIKLHRKLKHWEWYDNHNTCRLFMHLLLSVNSKVGEHHGIEIQTGCVKTGRKELAKQTGLSEQQVRRSLNNLQKSQDITIKPTNKFSIITVVNWGDYQSGPDKTANKSADKRPTNAPINDHKQEVKKKDITSLPPLAVEITDLLVSHVASLNANAKNITVNLEKTRFSWAEHIEKINRIDKHEYSEIKEVLNWAIADDFWFRNILSGDKLRKQFDKLNIKRAATNMSVGRKAPHHFVANGKSINGEALCDKLTRAQHLEKYGRVS